MAHCCKYTKGKEETFVFVSHSNQHVCKGKNVNRQLRLVSETVTKYFIGGPLTICENLPCGLSTWNITTDAINTINTLFGYM